MPPAHTKETRASHQLYLFRHGETDWNREHRMQGQTDIPLNATGVDQAYALAERLRPCGLQAIVTSDLARAAETARIVAAALSIPVYPLRDLREVSFGEAEGMVFEEAKRRFGPDVIEGRVAETQLGLPGGELGLAVRARALAALAGFVAAHDYRQIGISTHSGVMRQFLKHALDDGPTPRSKNGEHFVMDYDRASQCLTLVGGVAPLPA